LRADRRVVIDGVNLVVGALTSLTVLSSMCWAGLMEHVNAPSQIASSYETKHRGRLRAVLNVCKRMTSVGDVVSLLELITIETKELLNADRVSIFLLDREKCELWSMISQEKRIIRFDARLGIAGSVAMTGQTINVADLTSVLRRLI
jgi:hypothetical protein